MLTQIMPSLWHPVNVATHAIFKLSWHVLTVVRRMKVQVLIMSEEFEMLKECDLNEGFPVLWGLDLC